MLITWWRRRISLLTVVCALDAEFPGVDPAPWFGYCTVPQQQRTLMLPDTLAPADLQCPGAGDGCRPGAADAREPRAVFLGSPTGWHKGKRKAVLLAGMQHPEQVCAVPALGTVLSTSSQQHSPREH